MDIYHIVIWFFLCSLLGYLLECVVLSAEHKTPVLNRGFGHGPFCIIYGFGALGASILLKPVSDSYVELYLASMIMATLMELFTASVMIHLFGSFWWDYSEKPFNYKGIICLESSLGWGFLGIVYYGFLNGFLHRLVGLVPESLEKGLAMSLLVFYIFDFLCSFRQALREDRDGEEELVIGRLSIRP